jgi:hypothetical protein
MLWVCPPLIITQQQLSDGLDIIEDGLKIVDAMLVAGFQRNRESLRKN